MNQSLMIKQHILVQDIATFAKTFLNQSCVNCIHFQKFKHPLQEIHYPNSAIGTCRKMNRLIFKVQSPRCMGVLYEEK